MSSISIRMIKDEINIDDPNDYIELEVSWKDLSNVNPPYSRISLNTGHHFIIDSPSGSKRMKISSGEINWLKLFRETGGSPYIWAGYLVHGYGFVQDSKPIKIRRNISLSQISVGDVRINRSIHFPERAQAFLKIFSPASALIYYRPLDGRTSFWIFKIPQVDGFYTKYISGEDEIDLGWWMNFDRDAPETIQIEIMRPGEGSRVFTVRLRERKEERKEEKKEEKKSTEAPKEEKKEEKRETKISSTAPPPPPSQPSEATPLVKKPQIQTQPITPPEKIEKREERWTRPKMIIKPEKKILYEIQ
jgi:hypothetical protein